MPLHTFSVLQVNDRNELLKRKRKIEQEIELTNKLLEDTRGKKENTVNEFKLISRKIYNRNRIIKELNREIEEIEREKKENEKTFESLKNDLAKVKDEYSNLVYHAFKNRNNNLNFMYLLASEDINQFYLRFKYLQQYKDYRIKQINLINKLNEVIEKKIIKLNENKKDKVKLINRKLTERATLKMEIEEADIIINTLKKKESVLIKELDDKKRIAKRLEKEIEDLIKEETKRKKFKSLTPQERLITLDFEKNRGRLPWPTERGVITEFFGENNHPVMKNLKVKNNGIDISTVPNSKVRALFKGEVSKIFAIKGANSTVIIRHGNFFTVYHNLINVSVKVGDIVETKQIIGIVYSDVKSGETIIHLEIWKELELQNPSEWLSN